MAEIKFRVWHNGDSSVGISGDSAEVIMELDKTDSDFRENLEIARMALKEAFGDLWGWKTHVMTFDELESLEKAIDESLSDPPGFLKPSIKTCYANEAYRIKLEQHEMAPTSPMLFRLTYGLQVKDNLFYDEASAEIGKALMHALTTDGKIENT